MSDNSKNFDGEWFPKYETDEQEQKWFFCRVGGKHYSLGFGEQGADNSKCEFSNANVSIPLFKWQLTMPFSTA